MAARLTSATLEDIPVYTDAVAKVMISLPDELLARLDEQARRRGSSRSGLLRELAERELAAGDARRRAALTDALEHADSHGGQSVRDVREQRRRR